MKKEELIKRGIVPGARIKCAYSGREGIVYPVKDWMNYGVFWVVSGDSIGSLFGWQKEPYTFAEVITPPTTKMAELLKDRPDFREAFEVLHGDAVPPREPEFVEFKEGMVLHDHGNNPAIYIGTTEAPEGLRNKCLMVKKSRGKITLEEPKNEWYITIEKLPCS